MTAEQIAAEIAALEAAIALRLRGGEATRVKEGDNEAEFARVSLAEMNQRLATLKALQAGTPPRVAARRVLF